MRERFKVSVRRSCDLALLRRSVWYAKSQARDQSALRQRIRDIAMSRPRFGYLRVLVMLKREGWAVGKKRVYRLYRLEGLQLRMKVRRRKRIALLRGKVAPATAANQHWSMDFVHDQMHDGRKFRILTVIDQWSRESVSLEANFRLTGRRWPGAGRGRQTARMASRDHGRQRHRVHLQGAGRLGLPTWRQARLHAAGQAHG
jgi:putative transposase